MENGTLARFERAVEQYCSNGKGMEQATEELHDALGGPDEHLRAGVAELLLTRLEGNKAQARTQALHILQLAWWPPAPPELAARAFEATLSIGAAVEPFTAEAEDAALLLANVVRANPELLTRLEAALGHPTAPLRRLAAAATGRVGPPGTALVSRLAALLSDVDPAVGDAALESLSSLAPLTPPTAMPALIAELRRSEGMRRYLALAAVRAIVETAARGEGEAGLDLAQVADAVTASLGDPEAAVRLQAVALLGATGAGEETALALGSHVTDEDPSVAAAAVVALAKLGKASPQALAVLERFLASGVSEEREGAFNALEGASAATIDRLRSAIESAAARVTPEERRVLQSLLATVN